MQQGFDKRIYRYLLLAAILVLATGTMVYHYVEHLSWVNAYYFSVITLATVGYGDIVPHTDVGKIFTTFYILAGVGIITAFISYSVRRQAHRITSKKGAK